MSESEAEEERGGGVGGGGKGGGGGGKEGVGMFSHEGGATEDGVWDLKKNDCVELSGLLLALCNAGCH